jgi:ubiquinone/menaquinone biosynthesis C-methylase UbiE
MTPATDIAGWAFDVLRCPETGEALRRDGDRLVRPNGSEVGRIEDGIVRTPLLVADDNVRIYRKLGGAHFWERANAGYAMSALDTPVYHDFLRDVRPASSAGVIVDVGGGDGRNARPWLEKGYRRVVVVDAAAEGLARFRSRIGNDHPEWLDHVLLIEADARRLPLKAGCADTVMAIESLFYLNDDYELGLRQCKALLAPHGQVLLSERDYEGGLLLQLLYQGVAKTVEASNTRTVVDGLPHEPMVSRCFTEQELVALLSANGLAVKSVQGISLLSVVLGWMRNRHLIGDGDAVHLPAVRAMLGKLGREGRIRRCHIVVAGLRT